MAAFGLRAPLAQRLVTDVLGGQAKGAEEWRVLVLDDSTTSVLSACLKMSDLVDLGFSLVEDLNKQRAPMPALPVTYFVAPTVQAVNRIVADWPANEARYRSARVFFSRPLPPPLLATIQRCTPLVTALTALAEANVDFIANDPRAFTVAVPNALQRLYGDAAGGREPRAGQGLRDQCPEVSHGAPRLPRLALPALKIRQRERFLL